MSGAIGFADTAVNCIVGDISIGGAALDPVAEVGSPV
jgi:hypothetical protein